MDLWPLPCHQLRAVSVGLSQICFSKERFSLFWNYFLCGINIRLASAALCPGCGRAGGGVGDGGRSSALPLGGEVFSLGTAHPKNSFVELEK